MKWKGDIEISPPSGLVICVRSGFYKGFCGHMGFGAAKIVNKARA